MYDLSRTVRFCVNLAPQNGDGGHRIHNSFGGWPSMSGFGAYYELDVRCRGGADPVTGYLMNISEIDKVVRQHAIPLFEETIRHRPQTAPGMLLSQLVRILQQSLNDTVRSVRLRLTPYYSVAMRTRSPDEVEIRQQFEFSASHRLHVASMTDQRNREVFGKCNNPNSHGHNYRIEVAVAVPLESIGVPSKPVMSLP